MINAFRHQRFLHSVRSSSPSSPSIVINAFRHQRFLHQDNPPLNRSNRRVINAFRHQRFLHSGASCRTRLSKRDQRLSASKIFAPPGATAGHHGTGVINAFRHQRFLHLMGAAGERIVINVINAFRHQRFLHRSAERTSAPSRSDQRLSASKIFAHSGSDVPVRERP